MVFRVGGGVLCDNYLLFDDLLQQLVPHEVVSVKHNAVYQGHLRRACNHQLQMQFADWVSFAQGKHSCEICPPKPQANGINKCNHKCTNHVYMY
eukprot:1678927-Amphidinium_carterae.1